MTVNQLNYYDKAHSINFFILLNHVYIIFSPFLLFLCFEFDLRHEIGTN